MKQQITLWIDADIITWFKAHACDGRGYQTDINGAHREHVPEDFPSWVVLTSAPTPLQPQLVISLADAYETDCRAHVRKRSWSRLRRGSESELHTLRHSHAKHLLMNGIPINYLSRWLGHSSIQTTLIYLELVPDPSGSLVMVP